MKTRLYSALLLLPLLILVYIGGKPLVLACFVVGLLGVGEFFRAFGALNVRPSKIIANASLLLLYAVGLFAPDRPRLYMLWTVAVTAASFLWLFRTTKRRTEDGLVTLAGVFYVCLFSFHVVLTDGLPRYGLAKWLIFISAFGTDVAAYLTGRALGRHKLCPSISPNKTVEGAIGGLLGSVALCWVFSVFAMPNFSGHALVLGLVGGVAAQLGDLTASVFKRKLGVKDYGDLIPGHGGILDRFDSVLFTAPTVYYYVLVLLMLNDVAV